MTERWRPVVGYEDAYEVSYWLRVRSLKRVVLRGRIEHRVRERVLRAATQARTGYLQVVLSEGGPAAAGVCACVGARSVRGLICPGSDRAT